MFLVKILKIDCLHTKIYGYTCEITFEEQMEQ